MLKARGYQPKGSGITLDDIDAKHDFLALRSAMLTVLHSVNAVETTKLFDVELLAYASYHFISWRVCMRLLRIDERGDPSVILDKLRTLGDEHAILNPDYGDVAHVDTLRVILEKSAESSPYEVQLYQNVIGNLYLGSDSTFDTAVLHIRRTWQREGGSRLARFPSRAAGSGGGAPIPPKPGGDGSTPQASGGGARALSLRQRGNIAPAEGKREDTSGPYRIWVGTGRPCVTCFRMWCETDVHATTNGVYPHACLAAYCTGRALKDALQRRRVSRAACWEDEPPVTPAVAYAFLDGGSDEGFSAFEEFPADVRGPLLPHWTPYMALTDQRLLQLRKYLRQKPRIRIA
ncbi:hypothetical protein CYMTET_11900 [Cymbomonas tetramitiformis]|uniref:Uncharacterized protein n=1 Tax=Cymbomonas tetramitiformis TaxID=36881 RepID=A0AAE0GMT5_9CHLO|nr:hypothetical protein CYMTET_11900 [Cymbomonas tetramitiformis]